MRVIEPVRRWAATLPLVWRLRIDGQLSLLAHFNSDRTRAQLEHDLVDLLSCRTFRRSVLINREGTPPCSSSPSTTSGYISTIRGATD
jgi:hypothetical protein